MFTTGGCCLPAGEAVVCVTQATGEGGRVAVVDAAPQLFPLLRACLVAPLPHFVEREGMVAQCVAYLQTCIAGVHGNRPNRRLERCCDRADHCRYG